MRILLTIPLLAALAACSGDRAPAAVLADEAATPVSPAEPDRDSAAEPDADAPAEQPAQVAAGESLFTGYGEARLGMTVADVTKAWRGVAIERGEFYEDHCYYLSPKVVQPPEPESPDDEHAFVRADFLLMIEEGVFVRYDVNDPNEVAPGGGKIGMTKADILRLYPGRVEALENKYDPDAEDLRIKEPEGGKGVLLFVTDSTGKVVEWRVGQEPQVDYVEGCS